MDLSPIYTQINTEDKISLPGFLFEPEKKSKKAAIYLHGMASSVFYNFDKLNSYSTTLNSIGIAFFAFNNRGANLIKNFKYIDNDGVELTKKLGSSYEIIKDCIFDIDAAVSLLRNRGYEEFYLIGHSTGANKAVVYNYYKIDNPFKGYILLSGGDDLGLYYEEFGRDRFIEILNKSSKKVEEGLGEELIPYYEINGKVSSWQSFYDIANPDGDYNTFPFREYFNKLNLSGKQPLFNQFSKLNKKSLIIYGDTDFAAWPDMKVLKDVLVSHAKEDNLITFESITGADHGFSGKTDELMSIIKSYLLQFEKK